MTIAVDVKAELTIAWGARAKLRAESEKLWAESAKLWAEGAKLWAEGEKLRAESAKLWAEGDKLWACKILELCGNITVEWQYIDEQKVEHAGQVIYSSRYRCTLGNGMVFEP